MQTDGAAGRHDHQKALVNPQETVRLHTRRFGTPGPGCAKHIVVPQQKELRTTMKKAVRLFALLLVPALVLSVSAFLTACGRDEDGEAVAAKLVSADPKDGSEVAEGSTITLTFDTDPGEVTANGVKAEGAGTTRRIKADKAKIELAWANGGAATLNYTLTAPDKEPPKLTKSTPADGAKDVDPADVNPPKGIVLEFSEKIAKSTLKLQSDGADLGWLASPKDNVVTLNAPKGKEAVNEKTYVVVGTVEDVAGNKTEVKVTFTTKAKQ
jgi:hypothetical protein